MSNSPLVEYTHWSPNYSSRNGSKILKITPHHMAGNASVEAVGNIFARPERQASSTYAIDSTGKVAQYVDEMYRPWTSGSYENDRQAVTIEVADDSGAPDWHISDTALNKLIDLCEDICRRNDIKELIFTGDANGNLTQHCYFQATNCPGPYLNSKFPYIAEEVNRRLRGEQPTPKPVSNVDVIYSVYTNGWLDPVVNYNESDYNGYAGWDGKPITGVRCNLSNGSIKYRVHIKGGEWLDWVVDEDPTQGGYAGLYGQSIDGIQMCLINLPNYHIEYRTRILNGEYLSWIKNCGEGDYGYSGLWGKELDRLQIRIIKDYEIEEPKDEEQEPIIEEPKDETPKEDKKEYIKDDDLSLEDKVNILKEYFANLDPDTGESNIVLGTWADANHDGEITSSDLVIFKKKLTEENQTIEEPVEEPKEDKTESIIMKLIHAIINLFKTIFGKKKD